MKYIYTSILLLMLAARPAMASADHGAGYLAEINLSEREVSRKNGEVELKMVVDLSRLKIRSQHTMVLVPVLVSADGSREVEFSPVVIDGKTRNKVYLRAQRLKSVELPPYHGGGAQAIVRRDNGKEQKIDYRSTLPYERWMLNGRIEVREEVSGCANCKEGQAELPLPEAGQALAAFTPVYHVGKVVPAPEPVKARSETRTARLQFRQNSSKMEPDYQNNREELNTVASSINLARDNADLTITGIYITGYASPEGSEAYNRKLSKIRADALAAHAQKDTKVDAALWHVTGAGEDWAGLRKEVEKHPQLLKIDEVLRIIDECDGDLDACERRLKGLPVDVYKRLVDEMYGPLRRNEYRIEYNVRNFNIEEARQQIKTRPNLLSVEEIHKVAENYGEGTDGYREVLLVAACTYPGSVPAVVNAARAELQRGDLAAAIRLLEGSQAGNAPEVLNALGVAYARNGQHDKAREALQRALKAGSAEARTNLEQLEGAMADL